MPHASLNSAFGRLTVFEEDGSLVAVEWGRAPDGKLTPLLSKAVQQLEAYFDGRLHHFSLPLRPPGSSFQQRVWSRLRQIPCGKAETYGALARQLATSPRAVARACGANPLPIIVPCHRVVAARGRLGGYSGGDGLDTKLALLRLEGAPLPSTPKRQHRSPNTDLRNPEDDMSKAIRIHETGGPEVLRWEDVDVGSPGPGQARLRQMAIGLNYIDVYHRSGLYPLPALPAVIGMEAAGIVEEVGEGVTNVSPGQRVAYAGPPPGAYAEERLMPANRLVLLPDGIDDKQAAGMMLRGMTAQYLLRRTYRVQAGDPILVHAAAGGVGSILCQWAKHLGAMVIGTAGSDDKAAIAKDNGCDHTIVYSRENFAQRVREITGGTGVAVVYDGVGKATFEGSLDCLRPLGMMVSYGNASGPVPPFEPSILSQKGSLFFTRPTLVHYTAKPEDLQASARELFDVVLGGYVRIAVNQTYPLKDAAQAHRDLEARKTTGSTVLLP
jgi:NADPH2:quinone reductase